MEDDVTTARPGRKGLAPLLTLAERATPAAVVVDLSNVERLDSPTLMGLVRADKTLRAAGGGMVLTALRPAVRRVLRSTGLDGRLEIEPTSEAARERLRARPVK